VPRNRQVQRENEFMPVRTSPSGFDAQIITFQFHPLVVSLLESARTDVEYTSHPALKGLKLYILHNENYLDGALNFNTKGYITQLYTVKTTLLQRLTI